MEAINKHITMAATKNTWMKRNMLSEVIINLSKLDKDKYG